MSITHHQTEPRTDQRRFKLKGGFCFDEWGWRVGSIEQEYASYRVGTEAAIKIPTMYSVKFYDQRFISSGTDIRDGRTGQVVGSFDGDPES